MKMFDVAKASVEENAILCKSKQSFGRDISQEERTKWENSKTNQDLII